MTTRSDHEEWRFSSSKITAQIGWIFLSWRSSVCVHWHKIKVLYGCGSQIWNYEIREFLDVSCTIALIVSLDSWNDAVKAFIFCLHRKIEISSLCNYSATPLFNWYSRDVKSNLENNKNFLIKHVYLFIVIRNIQLCQK